MNWISMETEQGETRETWGHKSLPQETPVMRQRQEWDRLGTKENQELKIQMKKLRSAKLKTN